MIVERILCVIIGYVFGLFQTGFIYGKIRHIDIREHGSGNSGTTNALRTLGWKAGAITFVGDCLKCIAAVVVARLIFGWNHELAPMLSMYAGAGAVLGHNYPCYLKFKGGKGIATTAGLVISFGNPFMIFSLLALFILTVAVTKYVSLGSLLIAFFMVVEVVILGERGTFRLPSENLPEFYGIFIFLMVLAFIRHRQNIVRLCKGTENKIGASKKTT